MSYKIYMKIDGLAPETPTLEVMSFSWGATNTSTNTGGGGGTGRVHLQDLSVMRLTDENTPALFAACATGKHFPKVELSAVGSNADGKLDLFYKLTLSNALVSSIQHSGAEFSDEKPIESLSFHYMKVDVFAR